MVPNKIPVFKYPPPPMGGKTNISLDTGFNFKSKGILIMETTKHNETVGGGREGGREKGERKEDQKSEERKKQLQISLCWYFAKSERVCKKA